MPSARYRGKRRKPCRCAEVSGSSDVLDRVYATLDRISARYDRMSAAHEKWKADFAAALEAERMEQKERDEAERKKWEERDEAERKKLEERDEAERKKREERDEAERKKREEEMREYRAKRSAEQEEDRKLLRNIWKEQARYGYDRGALVEAMFVNLGPKLAKYGYRFPRESRLPHHFVGKDGQFVAEADRLIINGDSLVAVEVKALLKHDDVVRHKERLAAIRKCMTENGDERKLMGAVAGGLVPEQVLRYAQKNGMFVFMKNGEDVSVAEPPEGFAARVW